MLKTFSCRLYPSKDQESRLFHFLQIGRRLYNFALEERIRYYRETGKTLSLYDQFGDLVQLRSVSQVLANVPSAIERDALQRLDKAFKNFFRRLKEGKGKPGFPRFKGPNRWNSFIIGDGFKKAVRDEGIRINGIDDRVKHRGLQSFTGTIKQQRIVHRVGKWFCQFVVEDGVKHQPRVPMNAVGIDLGLNSFSVLSNGEAVDNPRFHRRSERKLKRANRSVSRKKKGSRNRRKAVRRLQRVHEKVRNRRADFTHKLSRNLVDRFHLIAVERLGIAGMVRSGFSKSIYDAAWGQFLYQLTYKAESAGGRVVAVNPRGTSQDCSRCGERVQKDLASGSITVPSASCNWTGTTTLR